ncbi:MAG: archaellin/type IV pilin N-terminal domain-containing protein [Candidatus Aenigmatarchaeota archaeon]
MKGISTVLATILLLMITLALVAMAAGFIFGWWGRASQGIEIIGQPECLDGQGTGGEDKVVIYIRNFGSVEQEVEIKQTLPSGEKITDYSQNPPVKVDKLTIRIKPLEIYTFEDDCGGTGSRYCVYDFLPKMGGYPLTGIQVPCVG